MPHLLVVDDEPSICWGLMKLAIGMGLSAESAASAEKGLELARQHKPDVLFLDVRLPGMDGLTAMKRFHERMADPPGPIIVMTAYGELTTAVEAVRNGAFDYLTKPFDVKVARHVLERALRRPEPLPDPASPTASDDSLTMVGRSAPIQEVFKRIALVAGSEACVHVRGESGTGKELAARAIHRYSRRRAQPFVAVNVASLSPTLAESELFGHVRGAFTGADQSRKGLLEQADGGTLFLDEVADIPMPVQVKLLRAVEHGEVLPVGAEEPIQVDLRIISATHQDLCRRVAEGEFRHDLYFRLVTFEIEIPPLRERREDIRELAEHFVHLLALKNRVARPSLSRDILAELERRPWYGNVRELRNAIEHAMILSPGGNLAPEYLPAPTPAAFTANVIQEEAIAALVRQWAQAQLDSSEPGENLHEQLLDLVEPPLLKAAAEHFRGQAATAARRLGLHRTTLRKKWDRYGIEER
jgi:two-component system, NtrC family, nitrogen regulation response regulator GlnG